MLGRDIRFQLPKSSASAVSLSSLSPLPFFLAAAPTLLVGLRREEQEGERFLTHKAATFSPPGSSVLQCDQSLFLAKMGDHFVLLVDRLLTESTLEATIESRSQSLPGQTAVATVQYEPDCSPRKINPEDGSQSLNFVECRICQDEDLESNMETPCSCCGSLKLLGIYHLQGHIRYIYVMTMTTPWNRVTPKDLDPYDKKKGERSKINHTRQEHKDLHGSKRQCVFLRPRATATAEFH
ncbi:hypothetical protein Taro_029355 [Colocasia esculenta]|uniref:Uncharacterized protein n=1 Tax=Colocasia esculenta TaxID=4460 RepID=A0A843VQW8_COLES|nr:hypothetical protein [Colocasia esculenta]